VFEKTRLGPTAMSFEQQCDSVVASEFECFPKGEYQDVIKVCEQVDK